MRYGPGFTPTREANAIRCEGKPPPFKTTIVDLQQEVESAAANQGVSQRPGGMGVKGKLQEKLRVQAMMER